MIENRKSARHDVSIAATLTVDGQEHPTVIDNLSVGGALISFATRLAPESRLTVSFRVPTHEQAISVGATVRWASSGSIGVQFDGLRAGEVWSLNKYFASLPSS